MSHPLEDVQTTLAKNLRSLATEIQEKSLLMQTLQKDVEDRTKEFEKMMKGFVSMMADTTESINSDVTATHDKLKQGVEANQEKLKEMLKAQQEAFAKQKNAQTAANVGTPKSHPDGAKNQKD